MRPFHKALLALAPMIVACSSGGGPEATSTSAAAIVPEEAGAPTSYTFTLSVGVNQEVDGVGHVYSNYATLASSVNTAKPEAEGCLLGDTAAGGTLSTCQDLGSNGLLYKKSIVETQSVSGAVDVVNLGVALDNIEGTQPAALGSDVAVGLAAVGNWLQTVGSLIGVGSTGAGPLAPAFGVVGGVVAGIGAGLSLISSLISPPSGSPPNWCAAGLIGTPTTPYALGPAPGGWVTPPGGGAPVPGPPWIVIPNAPRDSMYLSYTAQQLESLTASGPATLSFPVSVQWPQVEDGVTVQFSGYQPGACDSKHTINITVARTPATGPAADPLTSSTGAARTANELDGFVADPAYGAVSDLQWTPSTGWRTGIVTPSAYKLDYAMPSATLSRALPPPGQSLTLLTAPNTPAPASDQIPGTNLFWGLDTFWFDATGNLYWSNFADATGWVTAQMPDTFSGIPNGLLTATSRGPTDLEVFWVNPYGNLMDSGQTSGSFDLPAVLAAGAAPPGASVAAVSLGYNESDVFYLDDTGTLQDTRFVVGQGWTTSPLGTNESGVGQPGGFVTAVARDANDIDVFFIGKSGAVYQGHYSVTSAGEYAAGPVAPAPIQGCVGVPGAAISAVSRAGNQIDLAYVVSAHQIALVQYGTPESRSGWYTPSTSTSITGVNGSAPISLVARDTADLALFYSNIVYAPLVATWNQNEPPSVWQTASPALAATPFNLSLGATALSMSPEEGTVESTVVDVTVTGTAGQTVNLTATGLPSGVSATFSPASIATGGTSTLELVVTNAGPQTFPMTVTATGAGSESGITESVSIPVTLAACIPYQVTCSTVYCGTMTNGCGGTITCPACPVTCNTPACKCRAAGGAWNGKVCE